MNNILIALGIGIVAGLIDVIPMLIQKIERNACLSAFIHWLVLGLIIPFVNWSIAPWLKGMLIGLLSAVHVVFMIWESDRKSVPIILLFSALLGAGIGIAGSKLIVI